jgi:hypothetical protein
MDTCIPLSLVLLFLNSITISIGIWMIIDSRRGRKQYIERMRYGEKQGWVIRKSFPILKIGWWTANPIQVSPKEKSE